MEQGKTSALKVIIGIDWESLNWAMVVSFFFVTCFVLLRIRRFLKWKKSRVRAQRVTMVRVDVPFAVGLECEENVVAVICSSVKCRIELYWYVSICGFHKQIEANWTEDCVLKDTNYRAKTCVDMETGKKHFILDAPKYVSRPVPRYYPVAIIVRNLNKFLKPREGQALITTVHLGEYASAARVITQSLKLASGQITLLQRLFPSGLYEEGTRDLCVVCVEKPVSRVVLPCKHACLCHSCFERIVTCPMCRAGIQSFFCISPELEGKYEKRWSAKLQSFVKSVWLRL